MSIITDGLAADAASYLRELISRDLPADLARTLVRDWHTARLYGLYGVTVTTDPATSEAIVAQVLARLRAEISQRR